MESKTSAKDFFLHLGAMAGLYAVVISFLNLLFSIINKAFPEIPQYGYYFGGMSSDISLPVATLIILFPIFIILSWINHRSYEKNPEKKHLSVRKWLTYITLFIAGIILAADLVTILYKFLDGQDLTGAFLLKALAVLVVTGLVFGFYIQDIRDRVSKKQEKIWIVVTTLLILIAIILGFSVIGSPRTQRLIRYDEQKVRDLQAVQWRVINEWQVSGTVPQTHAAGIDTQTDIPYTYRKTGPMSFELCAVFNTESHAQNGTDMYYYEGSIASPAMLAGQKNEVWTHPAGEYCFSRTIDPILYPTQIRG